MCGIWDKNIQNWIYSIKIQLKAMKRKSEATWNFKVKKPVMVKMEQNFKIFFKKFSIINAFLI